MDLTETWQEQRATTGQQLSLLRNFTINSTVVGISDLQETHRSFNERS